MNSRRFMLSLRPGAHPTTSFESSVVHHRTIAPLMTGSGPNPVFRRYPLNVRITPKSGRVVDIPERQVCARTCRKQSQQNPRLFDQLVGAQQERF
jgi:hypothetical protein